MSEINLIFCRTVLLVEFYLTNGSDQIVELGTSPVLEARQSFCVKAGRNLASVFRYGFA